MYLDKIYRFCLSIFFTFSAMSGWAQSSNCLSHLEKRFAVLDRMIFSEGQQFDKGRKYGEANTGLTQFYDIEKYEDAAEELLGPVDGLFAEKVDQEIRSMKSENGLELSGQAYYRSSEMPSVDDEDANTPYNVKMQVELGWDYLKSSLHRRKGRIREIEIQGDIDKTKFMEETQFNRAMLLEETITAYHDSIIMGILQQQKKNFDILYDCQKEMVQRHMVGSKALVSVMERKSAIEHMMDLYTGKKYKVVKNLWPYRPEMLVIDTVRLNKELKGQTYTTRRMELERSLLDQKITNTNYMSTASVKPYVRYSYYSVPDHSNRMNVDVGLNVKFPLSWKTKAKKKELRARKQLLVYQEENVRKAMTEEVRQLLVQVEHLNFRCDNEYERVMEFYAYMLNKKKGYDQLKGEYNMPNRMEEYTMYIDKLINMEQLLRQRDLLIVELQKLMPHKNILELCSFYDIN